jgi:hypothetical protein
MIKYTQLKPHESFDIFLDLVEMHTNIGDPHIKNGIPHTTINWLIF